MRSYLFFVFLVSILVVSAFAVVGGQDVYGIEVSEFVWNRSTLNCLIVRSANESWWQPFFVNMTLRAIEQWNEAIDFFSVKYSEFGYLENVNLMPIVSDDVLDGFDIYVFFKESIPIDSADALGLARTVPFGNGTIEKVDVSISSKSEVVDLTRQDYRDVTTHELGHALGLGHSDFEGDLMYPYNDLYSSEFGISTLDLYGVALSFGWLDSGWDGESVRGVYSLPSGVKYEYAPVLDPEPSSAFDNPLVRTIMVIFMSPFLLFIFVFVLVLFVSLIFVAVKTRRRRPRHRY